MKIRKEIKIYIIAVTIVLASSPLIYWAIQNQINAAQNTEIEYIGHHEQQQDFIRFWTDVQPNSWSGMETTQKWSFTNGLTLTAHINVTSTGSSTFYAEILLVDTGDVDEGFGFQITNSTPGQVRIKGWSWLEEDESFSSYTDKPINVLMTLEARKTSTGQIDFYIDNGLIGSITTPIPSEEGAMNFDLTNGAQGGTAEVQLNYQVQQ
jgi:hypothetical protein